MQEKNSGAEDSLINRERKNIFEQCIQAGSLPPGIFSLTVPTGGGKTLSSMAFALEHVKKHNLKRIFYIIPYTSIIEQNADVFRDIFGWQNVLEHHSNFDPATVDTGDLDTGQRISPACNRELGYANRCHDQCPVLRIALLKQKVTLPETAQSCKERDHP